MAATPDAGSGGEGRAAERGCCGGEKRAEEALERLRGGKERWFCGERRRPSGERC